MSDTTRDEKRASLAADLFDRIHRHLDTWLPGACDDFVECIDDDVLRDLGYALTNDIMDKIQPIYEALVSGEYESLIKTRQLLARERNDFARKHNSIVK